MAQASTRYRNWLRIAALATVCSVGGIGCGGERTAVTTNAPISSDTLKQSDVPAGFDERFAVRPFEPTLLPTGSVEQPIEFVPAIGSMSGGPSPNVELPYQYSYRTPGGGQVTVMADSSGVFVRTVMGTLDSTIRSSRPGVGSMRLGKREAAPGVVTTLAAWSEGRYSILVIGTGISQDHVVIVANGLRVP